MPLTLTKTAKVINVVEAKILPKDIAFLRPGQAAMIKFSAYDFAIYGGLEAEVTHISADTITDDRDNTFYLVQLKTNRNHFADNLTIIPGMTTQVDIITGKAGLKALLFGDDLSVEGSELDLVEFFSLLDRPDGSFSIVTP